jgi:hypothetical protein
MRRKPKQLFHISSSHQIPLTIHFILGGCLLLRFAIVVAVAFLFVIPEGDLLLPLLLFSFDQQHKTGCPILRVGLSREG